MKKIKIRRNPNGDTRTATKDVSFLQFQNANDMHKDDVLDSMIYLSRLIKNRGIKHDYTKKTAEKQFYKDFLETMNEGSDFIHSKWYQYHIEKERHHLLSRCPEDVNLIDVLEMISDCVCAGLARSGEVRDLEISPDILEKAVTNTVQLLKDNIVVYDDIPVKYIIIYRKKADEMHRIYIYLYDSLRELYPDDVISNGQTITIDRIGIRIEFRCGETHRLTGLRADYYYADTYEAEEYLSQSAYKVYGRKLYNMGDVLKIVNKLYTKESEG